MNAGESVAEVLAPLLERPLTHARTSVSARASAPAIFAEPSTRWETTPSAHATGANSPGIRLMS